MCEWIVLCVQFMSVFDLDLGCEWDVYISSEGCERDILFCAIWALVMVWNCESGNVCGTCD